MEFKNLCNNLWNDPNQGYLFGHKNLWRSDVHERMDDSYNGLDGWGVCALWKFNENLSFDDGSGLHRPQYPLQIVNKIKLPYSLVHRGFATDYQIMTKYQVYGANGQSGWALERLLEESTLAVHKIDYEMLPDWFKITDDVTPLNKKKIREIYNETKR